MLFVHREISTKCRQTYSGASDDEFWARPRRRVRKQKENIAAQSTTNKVAPNR